jgi:pimeloyl-ACP methyl ester carboxylesterase
MARFVLVHGAFHGAWCWEPLQAALESGGHSVRTFDLPGSGEDDTPVAEVTLDAYVGRICGVLAEEPEPVVLVAHSMGGVPMTQALRNCPDKIARAIYLAGFLPGDGQSLVDLTQLPEGEGDMVQAHMQVDGAPPVATLPADVVPEAFYGECSAEQAAWATERVRPQALAPFVTPVELGRDERFAGARPPRAYVVATKDRALPTALQRRLVGDNPGMDVVEIESDHSPFLSRTAELAAALTTLAERGQAAGSAPVR